jgi:pantoate--beta-alanine ligase
LAEKLHAAGETDADRIRREMLARLAQTDGVETEYIALLHDGTVDETPAIAGPTVVAVAARVGRTRLIDNHTIG